MVFVFCFVSHVQLFFVERLDDSVLLRSLESTSYGLWPHARNGLLGHNTAFGRQSLSMESTHVQIV